MLLTEAVKGTIWGPSNKHRPGAVRIVEPACYFRFSARVLSPNDIQGDPYELRVKR